MWFNIDIYKLAEELLPGFLRLPVMKALVKSLLTPVRSIYLKWRIYREEHIYKLQHTGQVYSLEQALNDRFDRLHRRIFIANGNRYERLYLYTRAEQMPVYLGRLYLNLRSDYADTGVDFIVKVPPHLMRGENYDIKAVVDLYKEGVKRYKIEAI